MMKRRLKGHWPREGWHTAYPHTESLGGERGEKTTLMDTHGMQGYFYYNLRVIAYLLHLMKNLIAEQLQEDTTVNLCIDKHT